ncbi:MAG: insulinase family protein, partial [Archangium sp.]|nr:insulinase family protein [Archangium sp.]
PFARIDQPFAEAKPQTLTLPTPDKANAWYGSGVAVKLNERSADYPAMALATHMLGGGPSSRLFVSLREEKGLSYGAFGFLDVDVDDELAVVQTGAIFAPQNLTAVDDAMKKELERWSTLSKEDLALAKDDFLNQLAQGRTDDQQLARILTHHAKYGWTLQWDAELEKKLKAVTPDAVSAAVKKYVDPSKFVTVKAGDFKTVTAPK